MNIIDQTLNKNLEMDQADTKRVMIEKGRRLVNIPSWARCVVVADLYEDQSDSQTDYFHTTVKDTVFLAFSKTTRNNMGELKKAALKFEETKDFNKDNEVEEYIFGHSYLPNYFFGTSRWYGYKINKRKYFDLKDPNRLEELYIAAAQGRYLIEHEEKKIQDSSSSLEYVDYSNKAFAVIGDTKSVKSVLKNLGGRFNPRLTCGPGWIFSKTKLESVNKAINIIS